MKPSAEKMTMELEEMQIAFGKEHDGHKLIEHFSAVLNYENRLEGINIAQYCETCRKVTSSILMTRDILRDFTRYTGESMKKYKD